MNRRYSLSCSIFKIWFYCKCCSQLTFRFLYNPEKYPLLQFPPSLMSEFKIFDLTELDRATSLHPLYNQLTSFISKSKLQFCLAKHGSKVLQETSTQGCSVDKLCMLRSQPNIYMALKISTCHPVAGDLICKHRFSCHPHANDSLKYYFRPVSLCPNNDLSWPQISALAQLGHILSLHKTLQDLDLSSCSFPSAPCPHLAGTGETTTSQVHLNLVVSCNFLLIKKPGKSTGRIFYYHSSDPTFLFL